MFLQRDMTNRNRYKYSLFSISFTNMEQHKVTLVVNGQLKDAVNNPTL